MFTFIVSTYYSCDSNLDPEKELRISILDVNVLVYEGKYNSKKYLKFVKWFLELFIICAACVSITSD